MTEDTKTTKKTNQETRNREKGISGKEGEVSKQQQSRLRSRLIALLISDKLTKGKQNGRVVATRPL